MSRVTLYKFTMIISVLSMSFALATASLAATYYSSPAGSGSTCSSSIPCSLSTGLGKLSAGDTLYLLGGTYSGQQLSVSASGTSDSNRITIAGYPGQTAIFDGNNYSTPAKGGGGSLIRLTGNWITLQNVTAQYSGDAGVRSDGAHNIIDDVFSQHNWGAGILLMGNYDTAQNSKAYYNAVENDRSVGNVMNGGWGTGISCARYPDYCTIKNCTAWDNWGEGISTFEAWDTTMEDNVSYDNFSLQMYVSDTKNTVAQRNLLYCSSGNLTGQYNNTQFGVTMGDEQGCPLSLSNPGAGTEHSHNNTFINNMVIGCRENFTIGAEETNSLIANNDFVNAVGSANILFYSGNSTGIKFYNNIIEQDDSKTILSDSATGPSFSNNLWSKNPSKNTADSNIVIDNPMLSEAGTFAAGKLTGDYFKLQAASPAIGKALPLTAVTDDYFQNSRGSTPDIGAVQYQSSQTTLTAPGNVRLIQ